MATQIGPITPISQFEILRTDPWTNAINAYKGVKEGQGRGLDNQKMKEEMPYVGPRQDAALKQAIAMNKGLDYKNQQSGAEAPYYGQMAENAATVSGINAQYAEPAKMADIRLAESTAQIQAISAKLAEARFPVEQAKLQADLQKSIQDYNVEKYYIQKGWYTPEQKRIGSLMEMRGQYSGGMGQQPRNAQEPQGALDTGGAAPSAFGSSSSFGDSQQTAQPGSAGMGQQAPQVQQKPLHLNYLPPAQREDQVLSKYVEYELADEADKKGMQQDRKLESNLKYETFKEASNVAKAATEASFFIKEAKDNFANTPTDNRGWLYGRAPPRGEAAQRTDNAVKNLQRQLIEGLRGTGAISEGDLKLLEQMLPNRKMTPESFNAVILNMEEIQKRALEYSEFVDTGIKQGAPMMDIKMGWNSYISQNPLSISRDAARLKELREKQGDK